MVLVDRNFHHDLLHLGGGADGELGDVGVVGEDDGEVAGAEAEGDGGRSFSAPRGRMHGQVIVVHQRLPQRPIPLGRAVFQGFTVDVLKHVQRFLRRRKIRLADVEPIDLHPPILRRIRQRRQLPDRRLRHLHAAHRYLQILRHPSFC